MITVSQALEQLFTLVSPLPSQDVPLRLANGRVLARDVLAARTQPPFAASSMDGYAVKSAEVEADAMFKVVGEAAAGHAWDGVVGAGQAVRIFTGAPLPQGADFIVIQEDVTRRGDLITLGRNIDTKDNIRAAGVDFMQGAPLSAPRKLTPADIALLAAMNAPVVPVTRKPVVALISTGDELVMPGEHPKADQIIVSNTFGLAAMLEDLGGAAPDIAHRAGFRGVFACGFYLGQRRRPDHHHRRCICGRSRSGRACGRGHGDGAIVLQSRYAAGKTPDGRAFGRCADDRTSRKSGVRDGVRHSFRHPDDPRNARVGQNPRAACATRVERSFTGQRTTGTLHARHTHRRRRGWGASSGQLALVCAGHLECPDRAPAQ